MNWLCKLSIEPLFPEKQVAKLAHEMKKNAGKIAGQIYPKFGPEKIQGQ
jgi:hypothetical protein